MVDTHWRHLVQKTGRGKEAATAWQAMYTCCSDIAVAGCTRLNLGNEERSSKQVCVLLLPTLPFFCSSVLLRCLPFLLSSLLLSFLPLLFFLSFSLLLLLLPPRPSFFFFFVVFWPKSHIKGSSSFIPHSQNCACEQLCKPEGFLFILSKANIAPHRPSSTHSPPFG